ncbi:MAG TPA: hypothetical protein PLQ56_01570 [Aggregatilineales bacterium]|nr:hypothetical protein [Aggregatilineales bacterium]
MPDKTETYRVAGENAELSHYPARLARKSRCLHAIKHFVFLWNSRQLYRLRRPH